MFNYTGWVVSMSANGSPISLYSTSAGQGAPLQDGTWTGGGSYPQFLDCHLLISLGGACGVWMAGMPPASDGKNRVFFATGNGQKKVINQGQPASGRTTLNTLSEAMVNFAVSSNGVLSQQDYFEPYDYLSLDSADRDLGAGGVALFKLPTPAAGISTLAITCGKNGKCYVTNADNLGGYKLGVGGSDNIVQVRQPLLICTMTDQILGSYTTKVYLNAINWLFE
jgi:hypothetical protein